MKQATMAIFGLMLAAALLPMACVAGQPTKTCIAHGQATLRALTQGHYDQVDKYLGSDFAGFTPQKWRQTWAQIQAQAGTFRTLGALAPRELAGQKLLVASLDFNKTPLAALVACDDSDRVTTLRLVPAATLAGTSRPAVKAHVEADGVCVEPLVVRSPLGPLRGALTLPEGKGPFPAVVLVAGSGAHDLNETVGPNQPFRDIADGLAKHGVASLRYDKRTFDYGAKVAGNSDFTVDDEVTDDALTALHELASQKEIDSHRVFVLGHSLGAMMAPRIAKHDKRLAGVIMLAAPARSFLAVIAAQIRELGVRQGASTQMIAKQEQAIADEQKLLGHADAAHPPQGTFELLPDHPVQQAYLLSLNDYHQVATAKSLDLPMLILQGSNDFQVSPTLDFNAWKKVLAGEPRVTFHLFPELSHLFMPGPTRSPEDYSQPAHVVPAVIDTIAKWIKAQPSAK